MAKFKVGDKVRIKHYLDKAEKVTPATLKYRGKDTEITKVIEASNSYHILIDNGEFEWPEEVFHDCTLKDPLYKVGDKVIIRDRIGEDCDYKYSFCSEMVDMIGQEFEILKVEPNNCLDRYPIIDDNALYTLKGDDRDFSWASSMLTKDRGRRSYTDGSSGVIFYDLKDSSSKAYHRRRHRVVVTFK